MRPVDFQPGTHWAYRQTRQLTAAAARVEVVRFMDVRPKQAEIRHLGDDRAGMHEYVKPVHLICRWRDWPGRLRHEQRLALLISAAEPGEPDPVEVQAANAVFAATGEDIYVEDRRSYSEVDIKVVQRLGDRAQAQHCPWNTKPSFKERGEIWTTDTALVDLAIALAGVEPKMIHLYLDAQEVEYEAKGYLPGDRYMHDLLRKYKPA